MVSGRARPLSQQPEDQADAGDQSYDRDCGDNPGHIPALLRRHVAPPGQVQARMRATCSRSSAPTRFGV